MRQIRWITLASLVAGLLLSTGCGSADDKLASHVEDLTEIMTDGTEEPAEAVEDLHEFMRDNGPEMAKLVLEMIVELDEIEDGAERAERAKEMVETLEEPMKELAKAAEKFGDAAGDNEEAGKYLQEQAESWMPVGAALMEKAGGEVPGFLRELM